MAYFNKKIKILKGGSNVKIFNPRNVVDLRNTNTDKKKKLNLPSNNGSGTFLTGTQAPSCTDIALSNTQGCLNSANTYVSTSSGQLMSVGGGYETNPFRYRKPYSSVPQGKNANTPYQDPTQFYNTAKPSIIPDKPNNIDQSLWDKLLNLLGRTADSWNTIPAGVGSLIVNVGEGTENLGSGIGAGVAGVGAGIENTGKALDNNFMWLGLPH